MTHIPSETAKKLVILILIALGVQLVALGYVFYQSYQGRADLVVSQQGGCGRGKLDRNDNAQGWRTAQVARMETTAKELDISMAEVKHLLRLRNEPGDPPDLVAARKYNGIATRLEKRSRINCKTEFPKAGLLP